jgi:hypothetical protein
MYVWSSFVWLLAAMGRRALMHDDHVHMCVVGGADIIAAMVVSPLRSIDPL